MSMDATLQVRMDGKTKADVEALYRDLGTSFAEAVRMFAQQSLLEGGLPFHPTLQLWEDMPQTEVDRKLSAAEEDIQAGRVYAQEEVDVRMERKFQHG